MKKILFIAALFLFVGCAGEGKAEKDVEAAQMEVVELEQPLVDTLPVDAMTAEKSAHYKNHKMKHSHPSPKNK